jgi:hypothetical protein
MQKLQWVCFFCSIFMKNFACRKGGRAGSVEVCRQCHGQRMVFVQRQLGPGMIQQMRQACPACAGEGNVLELLQACKSIHLIQAKQFLKRTSAINVRARKRCRSLNCWKSTLCLVPCTDRRLHCMEKAINRYSVVVVLYMFLYIVAWL